MAMQVCAGAILQCSFGTAPSTLIVTPENKVLTTTPDANIMDHKPIKNIVSFVMCTTLSNPAVAAATAAASGTLTPAPCVPATAAPWAPGVPTVLIANQPALDDTSVLTCSYGGVITVKNAGQSTVQIP